MKKIFTTALLALIGTGAFAQTSQGTLVGAGSVNIWKSTNKYENSPTGSKSISRTFDFSPSVGYFIQDGLELGIGLGLNQSTGKYQEGAGKSRSRYQNISFSPSVRKYIALTEQLQLRGTGYVSVGFGNNKYQGYQESSYEVTNTSNSYGIGFYPSLIYFATPKLGFTATFGTLSYSRTKNTPKNNPNQTNPYVSHNLTADLSPSSVSLGIGYFIAR